MDKSGFGRGGGGSEGNEVHEGRSPQGRCTFSHTTPSLDDLSQHGFLNA